MIFIPKLPCLQERDLFKERVVAVVLGTDMTVHMNSLAAFNSKVSHRF